MGRSTFQGLDSASITQPLTTPTPHQAPTPHQGGHDSFHGKVESSEKAKVLVAALMGSIVEWYEFTLYGTLSAMVFEKAEAWGLKGGVPALWCMAWQHFFPFENDPVKAESYTQIAYALGFVTRPFGGVFFGHFGDKFGRQSTLIATLCVMGGATFCIGLLPTYHTIGLWSPGLLITLRCLQGFGLGGEWGAAVLMAYEFGSRSERGLFAAIPQIGLAVGLTISTATLTILTRLPEKDFEDYGWRIAFLLSGVLVFIGYYIRRYLHETPLFRQVAREESATVKVPFLEALRQYPRNIACGLGALWMDGLMFNVIAVWCIKYLYKDLHVPKTHVLAALTVAAIVLTFVIPAVGALTDRIGRKTVYILGCLFSGASGFFALNMYQIVADTEPPRIWLLYLTTILTFSFSYPLMFASFPALFADLFDTRVRYTGMSIVYQLSRIYSSGLSPLICNNLYHHAGKKPQPIMFYMLGVGLFSAFCTALIEHQRLKAPPHDEGQPAPDQQAVEEGRHQRAQPFKDLGVDSGGRGVEMVTAGLV